MPFQIATRNSTYTTGKHANSVGFSGGQFWTVINGAGTGGFALRKVYVNLSGAKYAVNSPTQVPPANPTV
ncbi:hypothetical protein MA16_Dca011636 [Dendrobium catenatum]|uniref:Uncharacterized protein n=1 Tax=Dendrobium catenatum TaxID=906689 RepID=A0A2I0WQT9_9ASPA|nr:hypothetical protein MA16_Dca011636 [Dendrobium catenatum]